MRLQILTCRDFSSSSINVYHLEVRIYHYHYAAILHFHIEFGTFNTTALYQMCFKYLLQTLRSMHFCIRHSFDDIQLMIHGNKLLVHFLVTFSPCVAYPGVRDNRSTLNTKTGYDEFHVCMAMMHLPTQFGAHIFIRTGDIWNFPKFIMLAATILVHGK